MTFRTKFQNIIIICIYAMVSIFISDCKSSLTDEKGLAAEQPPLILAPDNPSEWKAFVENLHLWRDRMRKNISDDDSLYDRPEFDWVSSAYNCYFLMMYDETFYDYENNSYSVENFLKTGDEQFGGYDIVVLWHAYPRIGLDERNQFDFYRDMPGGLDGIRKISDEIHRRKKKVYINYNPWDTGTRREDVSDIEALAAIVKAIDADGIFLDTMDKGAGEFRSILDAARPGVVLESELALPAEEIYSHHMSWAQWFYDSHTPGILRNKWIEPRHMQHSINRWSRDKSKDLQIAWMNGSGIMIWENIFGQWVGWNSRDKHILKTVTLLQKRFSDLFSSENRIPLVDTEPFPDVYTNLWYDDNSKLWTLVNRSWVDLYGDLLHIEFDPDYLYFDLVAGCQIYPNNSSSTVSGKIIPRGIGCIYSCKKDAVPVDMQEFLEQMAELNKHATSDITSPVPVTVLKPTASTKKYLNIPANMVEVTPFKGTVDVVFTCRETGYYKSIEDEFFNVGPPLGFLPVTQTKNVDINRFAIDETPVTNSQFKIFLDASGYEPRFPENFLKHWKNGKIPAGKEEHPVVYVSLEDARAYSKWANKRLPREEEWQLAAGGKEQFKYPWGNLFDDNKCNQATNGMTTSVKAYREGCSPCGAWDMCGNTWELTESEYSNGRSRFCILKGGSCYQAVGSSWYFDGGVKPVNFAAKQLLIYPGLDRCSTVGFRCVIDF
jgi:formylglycine-generating enzyme required for sulfatase activity